MKFIDPDTFHRIWSYLMTILGSARGAGLPEEREYSIFKEVSGYLRKLSEAELLECFLTLEKLRIQKYPAFDMAPGEIILIDTLTGVVFPIRKEDITPYHARHCVQLGAEATDCAEQHSQDGSRGLGDSNRSNRRGASQSGASVRTEYRLPDTAEILWRHKVIDERGHVVDDHYRPYYEPRGRKPLMRLNGQAAFGTHLPMFILDVLRHDLIEPISSIVKMLNNDGCIGWRDCWPHDFTVVEVIPTLQILSEEGYIEVLRKSETDEEFVPVSPKDLDVEPYQNVLWFNLTEKGRELWSNWEPPKS